MAIIKRWNILSNEEKVELINPMLDYIRDALLNDETLDCTFSTYSNDENPRIRNGLGEPIHVSYIGTDVIEIKLNRIKKT